MSESPPILTVAMLTDFLKGVVEETFSYVWVSGEISNLTRAGSGHLYFTLKDESAQLKAIMWRSTAQKLKFDLHDGLSVVAAGPIEVYPARGQYQIIADRMIPQGIGPLELAFRQLHEKLEKEGLFDPDRKRPLPMFPRRIALVTSPTGAAVRDLIQVMTRRWKCAEIIIVPVAVQGAGAAKEIAEGLQQAAQIPEVDVIVTGRGGGSLEDLWSFNEEIVARAIYNSPIPVISAVGHEIDVTIADLVADRRALTPSEAGELVVPLEEEMRSMLATSSRRLASALRGRAQTARLQLDGLSRRRCFQRPLDATRQQMTRLDDWEGRIIRAMRHQFSRSKERLEASAAALDSLSPLNVLSRGYSVTKRIPDGKLIRTAEDLQPGDRISTLLGEGEVISQVTEVRSDE